MISNFQKGNAERLQKGDYLPLFRATSTPLSLDTHFLQEEKDAFKRLQEQQTGLLQAAESEKTDLSLRLRKAEKEALDLQHAAREAEDAIERSQKELERKRTPHGRSSALRAVEQRTSALLRSVSPRGTSVKDGVLQAQTTLEKMSDLEQASSAMLRNFKTNTGGGSWAGRSPVGTFPLFGDGGREGLGHRRSDSED